MWARVVWRNPNKVLCVLTRLLPGLQQVFYDVPYTIGYRFYILHSFFAQASTPRRATMDCGCLEDVAGVASSSSAPAKPIAPAAPATTVKGLDGGKDSDLEDLAHWKKCTEKNCARCKFVRLKEKWQLQLPLIQKEWDIDASTMGHIAHGSWIKSAIVNGRWGVGCIACKQAKAPHTASAARNFADFSVRTLDALQMSNLKRHQEMDTHKVAVFEMLGLGDIRDKTAGSPATADFNKVLDHLQKGRAPHSGVDGVGDKKKISKMMFCLAEAKTSADRDFMRSATMCSHMRDERNGRLAFRCSAVNAELATRRFHMSVQIGMGTGASNITKATETAWREFSTEHHGALYSNRKPQDTDFKDDLFKNVREKHIQMIIDAASDEQLSARQMENRKVCICIYVHVSMFTPSFASTNV